MAPDDSPGSPLSDIDSDEFTEDPKFDSRSRDDTISVSDSHSASPPIPMPPAKRRRTGASAYDHATPHSTTTGGGDDILLRPHSPSGSISSDTSGDVPNSPSFAHLGPTHPLSTAYAASQANPDDPDAADTAQVTRCLWSDCTEPEQGNMDALVAHIHTVHIGQRQKKYSCEWEGCSRKGMPHASGYALRAHMRSHTREKPFYCALPECDRSFTRSDALAKHMRTVHETEALRPSDPVPKNHSASLVGGGGSSTSGGLKRIKLIVNNGDKPKQVISDPPPLPTRTHIKNEERDADNDDDNDDPAGDEDPDIDTVPLTLPIPPAYYPSDIALQLDEHDLALPPSQWFRLLRRQLHWAESERAQLEREIDDVQARTDIEHAKYLKTHGSETRGDKNRRLGWKQTEGILDSLLGKEVGQVWTMFKGAEMADDADPWQLVRGMEGLVG